MQRSRPFECESCWRLDYQIATPGLAKLAITAVVERALAHAERWSDHAPVTVTFDV